MGTKCWQKEYNKALMPLQLQRLPMATARFMSSGKRKKAGLIIIGDEILKGQVQDTNTHFLAGGLRNLGVHLERVSVISDDIDTIASEVKHFSNNFDLVLTSGGIGPTHDDVTFEGVARAFDDDVEHHPDIVDLCKKWFRKDDLTDPCFKLALIPKQAKLNFGTDKATGRPTQYPLISVENVFVFPGIPELLQKAFHNLGGELFGAGDQLVSGAIYLRQDEISITNTLNRLVKNHPNITFGSYPSWSGQHYRTKVTFEGESEEEVSRARSDMEELNPIKFDPKPTENTWDKIQQFLHEHTSDSHMVEVVEGSLKVMEECFARFPPESVSVCYNGGKDCIVMLHLVHAYFQKHFPGKQLKSFYISEDKTFPELDQFLSSSVAAYNLNNSVFQGPLKPGLGRMIAEDPSIQATVLGVRDGDPGSSYISTFSPTDGDWPKMMRVHPVLAWQYADVWTFLRGLCIPYPVLYDQGYTSLGNPENTIRNPALAYTDPLGETRFHPAHMLKDPGMERKGRL